MTEAHFVYIADVYCPWCYGFAPIMKKIAAEHPQLPVRVLGGNLMSHDTDLMSYAAQDQGLYDFWNQVEKTTGRTLAGALVALRKGEPISMYSPGADLILTALKHLAPGHALEQFFFMEDMFYARGQDYFTADGLSLIAQSWKVDKQALRESCNTAENEAETEADLELAAKLMGEITAYPSLLLVRGDKVDAVSRGYVHYETVAQRLKDAMQDLGLADIQPGEMCSWHGNCAFGRKR